MDSKTIESPHDSHINIYENNSEIGTPLGKKKKQEQKASLKSEDDIKNNYSCLKNFINKIKLKCLTQILIIFLINLFIIIIFMLSHIKNLKKK